MVTSFCHGVWENSFLHYVLPAVLAPLLAIICVYAFHSYLSNLFWLKALSLFGAIDFVTFLSYAIIQDACVLSLFGDNSDDPGDIGIVMLTFPLFMLASLAAILLLFFIRKRLKAKSVASN
jgi:hypothetical protein